MRVNSIVSKVPVKFKPRSYQLARYVKTPNLLLNKPDPTGKNQVWVGDVTYVRTKNGWSHSKRRVLSMLVDALDMAVQTQAPQD